MNVDFEPLWQALNERDLERQEKRRAIKVVPGTCKAKIVAALLRRDMTATELVKATGFTRFPVGMYLHELHAEGRVAMVDGGEFLKRVGGVIVRKLRLVA